MTTLNNKNNTLSPEYLKVPAWLNAIPEPDAHANLQTIVNSTAHFACEKLAILNETLRGGGFDDVFYTEIQEILNSRLAEDAQLIKIKRLLDNQQQRFNSQKTLENTKNRFVKLPKANQDSFKNSYLDSKGFSIADIPHSLKLRFDSDKTGHYLIYPIKRIDSTGKLKTINFQKIYTDKRKRFLTGNETGGGFSLLSHETKLDKEKHVFLTEGLATGLSSFVANGTPVFIGMYASNLAKVAADLKAAGFKKVITLTDNDPAGIKAALEVQKTCGYSFILPELENTEKCDFDDIRQAKGIEFLKGFIADKLESLLIKKPVCKVLLEKVYISPEQNSIFNNWQQYTQLTKFDSLEPKPHFPEKDYLTPEQASEKLQELTNSFFTGLDKNMIIKASAGSGKTRAVIKDISEGKIQGQVHVFVPNHKLANEWEQNLKALNPNLKILHLYGRGGADNTGYLCEKYDQVKQVQALKLPVFASMCKQGNHKCEFFDSCRYIQQFTQEPDIVILPQSYLSLNHATLEKKPTAVVIDESFFNTMISSHSYPIKDILSFNGWDKVARLRYQMLEAIDQVKAGKAGLFEALYQTTGLDYQGLFDAIERTIGHLNYLDNEKTTLGIYPGIDKSEFLKRVEKIQQPTNKEILPLLALYKELSLFPERTHSSYFRVQGDYFTINSKHTDNRFQYYINNNIPVLAIDADANDLILTEIFRPAEPKEGKEYLKIDFEEIHVKRQAKVFQYKNSQFAKNRFFTGDNPNIKEIERAEKIIKKIAGDKKTLVITYKKLAQHWLINEQLTTKQPNLAVLHFGNIRGIDAYKDFDNVIILGRNQPKASAMENTAAALFAYDKEAIQFSGGYEKTFRQYRSKSLTGKAVDCHKDERVQAILEQFRESESLQGVDRGRFIHSLNHEREIHILNDLALDIDIDLILDANDLIPKEENKLLNIFKLHNGILPLSPALLLKLHPEHFENLDQAKNLTRETELIKCKNDIKSLYIGVLHLIRYRVKGERGKHKSAYFVDFYSKTELLETLKQWHDDKELEFISIEGTEQNVKPVMSFGFSPVTPQAAVITRYKDTVFINPLRVENIEKNSGFLACFYTGKNSVTLDTVSVSSVKNSALKISFFQTIHTPRLE